MQAHPQATNEALLSMLRHLTNIVESIRGDVRDLRLQTGSDEIIYIERNDVKICSHNEAAKFLRMAAGTLHNKKRELNLQTFTRLHGTNYYRITDIYEAWNTLYGN